MRWNVQYVHLPIDSVSLQGDQLLSPTYPIWEGSDLSADIVPLSSDEEDVSWVDLLLTGQFGRVFEDQGFGYPVRSESGDAVYGR